MVLADDGPFVAISVARQKHPETVLEAKEVRVGKRRYIVCRNPEEVEKDAATREVVLASLSAALKRGDKALVGNTGYRRYLKTPKGAGFEIDEARVAEDARFDRLFVLRTPSSGVAGKLFQAIGIALPANIREAVSV